LSWCHILEEQGNNKNEVIVVVVVVVTVLIIMNNVCVALIIIISISIIESYYSVEKQTCRRLPHRQLMIKRSKY